MSPLPSPNMYTPPCRPLYISFFLIVGLLFEVIHTPAYLFEWILFSMNCPIPCSWTYMPPVWP